jgi:hypothetical protein
VQHPQEQKNQSQYWFYVLHELDKATKIKKSGMNNLFFMQM